jgi:signal transduction histidine kinase
MSARVSESGEFELRIEDDGRGFDEGVTKKKSGRGVANIRARASMIDGNVEWIRGAGGGTIFNLLLPTNQIAQTNTFA